MAFCGLKPAPRGRSADFSPQERSTREGLRNIPARCALATARVRFMESGLFLFELLSDDEPEKRKCPEIKEAMLRFMESGLFLADLPGAHEPTWRSAG